MSKRASQYSFLIQTPCRKLATWLFLTSYRCVPQYFSMEKCMLKDHEFRVSSGSKKSSINHLMIRSLCSVTKIDDQQKLRSIIWTHGACATCMTRRNYAATTCGTYSVLAERVYSPLGFTENIGTSWNWSCPWLILHIWLSCPHKRVLMEKFQTRSCSGAENLDLRVQLSLWLCVLENL